MRLLIFCLKVLSSLSFYLLMPLYYILFLIGYYLVGYRKKVVYNNIRNSFPEKTEDEIRRIQKGFYKHFFQFLIEYIKLIKGDENFFKSNVDISGWEKIDKDISNGQHVVIAMGHHGNWEYAAIYLSKLLNSTMTGIYKQISNKDYERLILETRGKFGLKLFEMKMAPREIIKMRKFPAAHLFIMDQSPMRSQSDKWITFLNQDTLVYEGVEKISCMLEAKVYWLSMRKNKIGSYSIKLSNIIDDAKNIEDGRIIEECYENLERDIQSQPETWLWSHKRWKHQRI